MVSEESGLHQLFEAQAASTPYSPAIVFHDGHMTYAQLDQSADALGSYLRSCGVATDDPVSIFMETCPEYIAAAIGALKAGGAFMPIPLDSPDSLLQAMVSESQPKVVLTKSKHLPRLSQFTGYRILPVDSDQSRQRLAAATRPARVAASDLAFLPYTSGTTGDPKGVMQTGGAIASSYFARYRSSSYSVGVRVACNIFFPWEFLRSPAHRRGGVPGPR